MKKLAYILVLVLLAVVGCSNEEPSPSWDSSAVKLPYQSEVVSSDFFSDPTVVCTLQLTTDARSHSALTLVAQSLVEQLPSHNLAMMFFYRSPEEAGDDNEFTVGRAWWGCNDPSYYPQPGDYSRHTLKITLAKELVEQNEAGQSATAPQLKSN